MYRKNKHHIIVPVVTLLLIFTVLCGVYLGITMNIADPAEQGQFGDMFGLANALFSGLAFSGLIYTILLQRNELTLQREELRLTRQTLESSAKSQEDQASNFSRSIQAQTYFEITSAINSA